MKFIVSYITMSLLLALRLQTVQRRFTKRLVRLRNMTYADRINFLKLDSLEEWRLRFDIIFT